MNTTLQFQFLSTDHTRLAPAAFSTIRGQSAMVQGEWFGAFDEGEITIVDSLWHTNAGKLGCPLCCVP